MTKSVFTQQYQFFIKLLIEERTKAGLTQQQLANRLKKPQSYVSKYENKERRLDVIELLEILSAMNSDSFSFITKLVRKKS